MQLEKISLILLLESENIAFASRRGQHPALLLFFGCDDTDPEEHYC